MIEQLRNVCALGSLQTVLAIPKSVPILHAGPGCGQKLWSGLAEYNGYQGSGYSGGHCVPCTNCTEKEIIFGGEDKLRTEIENALKIMDADLFVVLTGCTSEIVGDDAGGIVGEFRQQGKPVVYAETGGFKGNNLYGHELVLQAIADQYLQPSDEKVSGLVNLWASVPYQDPFWAGNLAALRKLLTDIGLSVNIIFGPGGGIDAVKNIPKADFNLLVSPWVGLSTVKHLKERFGTPYLHYPVLPIGPTETGHFLRTIGKYAKVSQELVEDVIKVHEDLYYYYIERCADFLFESRSGMPSRFVTVSDSSYSVGISRFLINDLGLIPETQFITDATPEKHQDGIRASLTDVVEGVSSPVDFTSDGGAVVESLRKIKFHGKPFIIGSTWDRVIARELDGYQLSVSLPVSDRLVLNRSYVGYEGALTLAEDIYSVILGNYQ